MPQCSLKSLAFGAAVVGFVVVPFSSLPALTSPDYDPEKNDFFTTFSPTGVVVRNTNENFVGAGYDWSGLVMFAGEDEAGYWSVGQRGFFSPVHIAPAAHTSAISAVDPNVLTTMGNERFQFNTTSDMLRFREGYNLGVNLIGSGYDLAISSIGMHIAPDSGITPYAVPDYASYVGREFFVTGHGGQHTENSPRVMVQKVVSQYNQGTAITTSFSNSAFAQVQSEGGDSGNNIFLGHTDPAGNQQLLLFGVTSGRSPGSQTNFYSVYGSTAGINASNGFMVNAGFAFKLVGESATSWTGADSADFGTAGNWTTGAPVAANYVTFDSAVSAAQTVDLGAAEKEMRGLVFNPGAAGEGFAFQNGTLLIGRGGMANYSAETQTFYADIRLTDHQVWDATYGGYLVEGDINLSNKLLVVQGSHDTLIEGVISNTVEQRVGADIGGGGGETETVAGTGPGLTKYGTGTLTLKSAATYAGTTWLYGGTLALEENGALPANTALVIGNNNTSRLEMNGKTLTLTRMVTSESISGGQGTVDLGAGGKINLYKSVNSGQDVFAAKITGGTAGTVALEIGGWQSSASISNSFWLTGASDYAGQTILKGQIGGEGSGNGLVMRIANTQALGAWGAGNETIIRFTDVSKPYVRFVAAGTYREDIILDSSAASTIAVGFEAADEVFTLDGDFVILRNIQTTGNQRFDLTTYGNTTVNIGDIRGELGDSGTAATGSAASTVWMWANDVGSVVNLNGEISDGTIKGAGTRGLAMDYRGAGNTFINKANSYTGGTSVRGTVTATVNALSGQNGAFGNATTAVTIGGQNTAYGQAILAGNEIEIGRNITVSASHTGALALGARDDVDALFSGSVALNRQADLTAGANSTVTFSGSITHAGGTSAITKTGAGTVILSGSNSHTGGTTVSEGTLRVQNDNALATTGTVSVNAGTLLIDAGVTVANPNLTVSGGTVLNHGVVNALTLETGVVGGRGLFNVAVDFNDAATDILAPGASPGITSFGVSQDWGGLNYQWEVQDFAAGGLAGTDFDAVAITGGLNLSGSAYELEIFSLDTLGNQGAVANYAPEDRQWTILTASSGITGFDAADWTINASAFEAYQPGAQFSLHQDGNSLVLSFSPIPEPGTLGLILLTSAGLLFLPRRRHER